MCLFLLVCALFFLFQNIKLYRDCLQPQKRIYTIFNNIFVCCCFCCCHQTVSIWNTLYNSYENDLDKQQGEVHVISHFHSYDWRILIVFVTWLKKFFGWKSSGEWRLEWNRFPFLENQCWACMCVYCTRLYLSHGWNRPIEAALIALYCHSFALSSVSIKTARSIKCTSKWCTHFILDGINKRHDHSVEYKSNA